MTDSIQRYTTDIKRRLRALQHGRAAATAPFDTIAEVVLLPSFHPETLLQACRKHGHTTFRLATMTSNVWYSEQTPTLSAPGRLEERVQLADADATILWHSLETLDPPTIQPPDTIGVDGMTVHVFYRQGSSEVLFEMWGADPLLPAGKLVHALYDCAWKALKNQNSVERLEQLHGYLRDTLPARLVECRVRCLKFYGGLTSGHHAELCRLFATLPNAEPLVIDMTNFDGMGTVLYPVFVTMAHNHFRLAWACSPAAKRHIQSMGLINPQVFETVDAAAESLSEA